MTNPWEFIPADVYEDANREEEADTWASSQRAKLADSWADQWRRRAEEMMRPFQAGVAGLIGQAGESIGRTLYEQSPGVLRQRGEQFMPPATGEAARFAGEAIEISETMAGARLADIEQRFDPTRDVRTLTPSARQGEMAEDAATTRMEQRRRLEEIYRQSGMSEQEIARRIEANPRYRNATIRALMEPQMGFGAGAPPTEETLGGGAGWQEALAAGRESEERRGYREVNPTGAMVAGALSPIQYPFEITGAAGKAAGAAGLAFGGVRKAKGAAKTGEAAGDLARAAEAIPPEPPTRPPAPPIEPPRGGVPEEPPIEPPSRDVPRWMGGDVEIENIVGSGRHEFGEATRDLIRRNIARVREGSTPRSWEEATAEVRSNKEIDPKWAAAIAEDPKGKMAHAFLALKASSDEILAGIDDVRQQLDAGMILPEEAAYQASQAIAEAFKVQGVFSPVLSEAARTMNIAKLAVGRELAETTIRGRLELVGMIENAVKDLGQAAETGVLTPRAKQRLRAIQERAARPEPQLPEEIAGTGGRAAGTGRGTGAPAPGTGEPRKPGAISPEAAKAAEGADAEMAEFLKQLYRMRAASAAHDEATVIDAQKRMDGLMDGFLAKARQAKAEKEAEKAEKLRKLVDEEGVDALGDPEAGREVSPGDFDQQVMDAIQKRITAIVAREGATGEKAPNEVLELVNRAFGSEYNTGAQQRLAAKMSQQAEKQANRAYQQEQQEAVKELRRSAEFYGKEDERAFRDILDLMGEVKAWETRTIRDNALAVVTNLEEKLRYGSLKPEGTDRALIFRVQDLVRELSEMKDPAARKAARQLADRLEKAETFRAADITKEAAEMESRSARNTAREKLAALESIRGELGTPLARQAYRDAMNALRAMGAEERREVAKLRQRVAITTAGDALKRINQELPPKEQEKALNTLAGQLLRADWSNPREVNAIAAGLKEPDRWAKFHHFRIMNMISGLPSMAIQIVSPLQETLIMGPATRALTPGMSRGEALRLAKTDLQTGIQSLAVAINEFAQTAQTGITARPQRELKLYGTDVRWRFLPDVQIAGKSAQQIAPAPWNAYGRFMAGADDAGWAIGNAQGMATEIARWAKALHKDPDWLRANLDRYPQIILRAAEVAGQRTYMAPLKGLEGAFDRLRGFPGVASHAIQFMVPFFRTLVNQTKGGFEKTLLGGVPKIRAIEQEIDRESTRLGRLGAPPGEIGRNPDLIAQDFKAKDLRAGLYMGGLVTALGFLGQKAGILYGYGPTDEKERADWSNQGGKFFSVRAGDDFHQWIQFAGQWAIPLAAGIFLGEAWDNTAREVGRMSPSYPEWQKQAEQVGGWVGRYMLENTTMFLNMTGMKSVADTAMGTVDPERYGNRMIAGVASSMVPMSGLLSTMRNMGDQVVRSPSTALEMLFARYPGTSGTVAPKRTQLGDVVTTGQPWWMAASPGRPMKAKDEPVLREYQRLREQGFDVGIGNVDDTISDIKLTPGELDEYRATFGAYMKANVEAYLKDPGYKALSPQEQAIALTELETRVREGARAAVKNWMAGRIAPDDAARRRQEADIDRMRRGLTPAGVR